MIQTLIVLYASAENKNTATPNMTRTTPITLFSVLGSALFANTVATPAHKRVNATHEMQTVKSGTPPIAK